MRTFVAESIRGPSEEDISDLSGQRRQTSPRKERRLRLPFLWGGCPMRTQHWRTRRYSRGWYELEGPFRFVTILKAHFEYCSYYMVQFTHEYKLHVSIFLFSARHPTVERLLSPWGCRYQKSISFVDPELLLFKVVWSCRWPTYQNISYWTSYLLANFKIFQYWKVTLSPNRKSKWVVVLIRWNTGVASVLHGRITLKILAKSIWSVYYRYLSQGIIHLESLYVNVKILSL